LSEGRSLRYENTFLLTTLLGSHIFDDMKNFLNFFFWIQSFYSATSKLVLRRGGPKHGPTLGGVYLQKACGYRRRVWTKFAYGYLGSSMARR